jgi:hypothetical protein
MLGAAPDLTLDARLHAIYPLADDSHFGVREWAWLALRPHLAHDLDLTIALLTPWTCCASQYIRRLPASPCARAASGARISLS